MSEKYAAFGDRLRDIRKEKGMSMEEFAGIIGTSKQVLSRYETNERAPKITVAAQFAERLGMSLDYLLGDTVEEGTFYELCTQPKDKPFYKIFIEITNEMGLNIPGIVRVTGLTDKQVRTIITRRVKDAPLPLALLLTDTLGVPLEIWTGNLSYKPTDISVEAREVARAYDRANIKDKNTARQALDLKLIQPSEERKL